MAQDGVLYVEILPSTKGIQKNVEGDLNKGFKSAEKTGTGFFNRMGKLAKGLTLAIGASVALVAGLAIKGGISRALNIEDAQAKLRGLGHDVKSIEAIMTDALASVKGTAFGLDTAATVASTAVAAGIKPGQELEKYLRLTADAATIAGSSMEEMGSILNKMTTSGKVYTQELNQLADRGLPVFQWLQEEYGVTAEELRKMVSAGEIDAERFRKVMEEKIGGAALASGDTTRGAFANMMAALSRLGLVFVEGPLSQAQPFFKEMITLIDGVSERVKNLIGDTSIEGNVFEGLADRMLVALDKIFAAFKILATGDFTEDMPWSEDSGIVDFLFNIREMLAPLAELMSAFSPLGAAFRLLQPSLAPIGEAFGEIAFALGGALTELLPIIAEAFANVGAALVPLIPPLLELILALVSGLTPVITALGPLIGMVADLFVQLMPIIAPLIDLVLQLVEALLPLLPPLIDLALAILPPLIDLFLLLAEYLTGIVIMAIESLLPVIDGLVKWFTGLIDFVVGIFSGDWERAWAGIAAMFEGWKEAIFAIGQLVVDWFVNLPVLLIELFAGAGEWLYQIGKDIVTGLWDGIRAIWDDLVKWFENAWNDMVAGWNDFWGIQSPSRLMMEMGHNIGEGFQLGIEDTIPDVSGTLSHMISIPELDSELVGAGSAVTIYAAPGRTAFQELADFRNRGD